MSDLPRGWARTTLGEIGDYLNGRGFKKSEWRESGRPIIRIQNLTGSGRAFNYFDGEPEERYTARAGDVLLSWAATLGVFVWQGPEAVVNQHIFKVESRIDREFHRYLLTAVLADLRRQTHGSGIVHITRSRFEATPVEIPPLEEQRRLVAALEEQFSRLDAAAKSVRAAASRRRALERSMLAELTLRPSPSWPIRAVEDVGRVQLGRQRSPKNHVGPGMRPYLRVANVFEDRLDLSDVKEMSFSDAEFERYELQPGDILLNEGQSPHLVGRPAIYRGELPGACFTNSLIRFQAGPDVEPEFALLVFRSHLHSGRFQREARITTNIAHMAAGRFRRVEFPLPSVPEQRRVVAAFQEKLSLLRSLQETVQATELRASALRRSILDRAFRGELVPQDPSDEPASALLDRIHAERAATGRPRRRTSRRPA